MTEWKVVFVMLIIICYFVYKYIFDRLNLIIKFKSELDDAELFPFDYSDKDFLCLSQSFESAMLVSFLLTGLLAIVFFILIFGR